MVMSRGTNERAMLIIQRINRLRDQLNETRLKKGDQADIRKLIRHWRAALAGIFAKEKEIQKRRQRARWAA